MDVTSSLTPHETLELQELFRSKVTEVKKLTSSMDMVQDSDLRSYMEDCLDDARAAIKGMQELCSKVVDHKEVQ